jgi:hypothetical protein
VIAFETLVFRVQAAVQFLDEFQELVAILFLSDQGAQFTNTCGIGLINHRALLLHVWCRNPRLRILKLLRGSGRKVSNEPVEKNLQGVASRFFKDSIDFRSESSRFCESISRYSIHRIA